MRILVYSTEYLWEKAAYPQTMYHIEGISHTSDIRLWLLKTMSVLYTGDILLKI